MVTPSSLFLQDFAHSHTAHEIAEFSLERLPIALFKGLFLPLFCLARILQQQQQLEAFASFLPPLHLFFAFEF